ncbi:hypothetical protein [Helicobacter sp.]|uniref:coiled-coil domain-containing protein n=1 Tax=Helicobacter sp. TaxID=218 RepID=UPI00259017CF|nr:hypothetical protein [Helicobacter sp.]MCI7047235.1 hypothetical protein [Helicobacter sp.]
MIETKISSGGGANNSASLKKNIVLLGGSNSLLVNGLQKGIREGIVKLNETRKEEEKLEFYNFALGGTDVVQNFYEAIRHKDILGNAELVITESNINELHHHSDTHQKLSYQHIYRYLNWFYQELYFLKTKVLVLILPFHPNGFRIVNNMHKKLCHQYGLNLVDMQKYYEEHDLVEFGRRVDSAHQYPRIMCEFGNNLIENIDKYQLPKKLNIKNDNPEFAICTPKDMELVSGELQEIPMKNSAFNEITYRIKKDTKLKFPDRFAGFHLIGVHTWNNAFERKEDFERPLAWHECAKTYSSLLIANFQSSLTKEAAFLNQFIEVQKTMEIDHYSFVKLNETNQFIEYHSNVRIWLPDAKRLSFCDLISFFLAKGGNFHTEKIDFEALANETIDIESKYNFNHLIPDVKLYKEIIDEYCKGMDPIKLAPLQKQLQQKDQIIQTKNQELESKTEELTSKTQQLTQTKNQLDTIKVQLDSTKQQLDSKVKELDSKTKELSSLPIKKQTLEIKNLEQDLINKQLHTKKLEKELGYESNILKELELNKQELIQTKNQLDSKTKELESKNKILSSNPNPSHFIQNTSCFKGKLAYLNTLTTAKDRIHNHLSYKLGQAMIENSKSLLGYIRMPYVLSYIKEQHNKEQKQYQEAIKKNPNLKLPNLESYPDYKESLKEKECLTYKLGEAFIKADKTWYKGGYVKLWFEVRRLRGERK